jgi:hypothetical protein
MTSRALATKPVADELAELVQLTSGLTPCWTSPLKFHECKSELQIVPAVLTANAQRQGWDNAPTMIAVPIFSPEEYDKLLRVAVDRQLLPRSHAAYTALVERRIHQVLERPTGSSSAFPSTHSSSSHGAAPMVCRSVAPVRCALRLRCCGTRR